MFTKISNSKKIDGVAIVEQMFHWSLIISFNRHFDGLIQPVPFMLSHRLLNTREVGDKYMLEYKYHKKHYNYTKSSTPMSLHQIGLISILTTSSGTDSSTSMAKLN